MAGHSKWHNIQHRKGAQDAKRGKVFTKLIKEIVIAAKMGGGVLENNPSLRAVIDKALAANMKRDTIENAVKPRRRWCTLSIHVASGYVVRMRITGTVPSTDLSVYEGSNPFGTRVTGAASIFISADTDMTVVLASDVSVTAVVDDVRRK